jgi:hypothetical protein
MPHLMLHDITPEFGPSTVCWTAHLQMFRGTASWCAMLCNCSHGTDASCTDKTSPATLVTNCALTNFVLVLAAGLPKALQAGQEDAEGNLRGQFHLDATVPGIQGTCCKGELKKYHMPLGMLFISSG